MGMRMDEMRRLSQLSPEAREGQSLTGAHLPPRGFYKLNSNGNEKGSSSCCGFPIWRQMPHASHARGAANLQHVSSESEVVATDAEDQDMVVEVATEELSDEQAAASSTQKQEMVAGG